MELRLFGITRDIVGATTLTVPPQAGIRDVAALKAWLVSHYPDFKNLQSLAVAVNHEYATDDLPLASGLEIALIPPVSGG